MSKPRLAGIIGLSFIILMFILTLLPYLPLKPAGIAIWFSHPLFLASVIGLVLLITIKHRKAIATKKE
ncbi:hypothetical protein ES703_111644 [subsurface metagenome]